MGFGVGDAADAGEHSYPSKVRVTGAPLQSSLHPVLKRIFPHDIGVGVSFTVTLGVIVATGVLVAIGVFVVGSVTSAAARQPAVDLPNLLFVCIQSSNFSCCARVIVITVRGVDVTVPPPVPAVRHPRPVHGAVGDLLGMSVLVGISVPEDFGGVVVLGIIPAPPVNPAIGGLVGVLGTGVLVFVTGTVELLGAELGVRTTVGVLPPEARLSEAFVDVGVSFAKHASRAVSEIILPQSDVGFGVDAAVGDFVGILVTVPHSAAHESPYAASLLHAVHSVDAALLRTS